MTGLHAACTQSQHQAELRRPFLCLTRWLVLQEPRDQDEGPRTPAPAAPLTACLSDSSSVAPPAPEISSVIPELRDDEWEIDPDEVVKEKDVAGKDRSIGSGTYGCVSPLACLGCTDQLSRGVLICPADAPCIRRTLHKPVTGLLYLAAYLNPVPHA